MVRKIAEALIGHDIVAADAAVELARRILWMREFTGASSDDVGDALNASATARWIAGEVAADTGKLLAAEELLLELRLCLYQSAYALAPGTRFGDLMLQQQAERRASQPAKLN